MKKQIAMFLVAVSLLMLVSCSTLNPSESVAETTIGTDITPTDTFKAYYPSSDAFSETPTRLLYVQSGIVKYYNKLTGENQIFCFDPLCRHSGPDECIAHKFMMADSGIQSIEYCEYDNRFYALRGSQFCSFAFDGSDLKVEYSFGEEGKFGANKHGVYMFGDTADLCVYEKYAFFLVLDKERGNFALNRFDIETKVIDHIFYEVNTNINGYLISNDTIYLSLVGNYAGFYRTKLDGSSLEKISDTLYANASDCIFDGEKIYMIDSADNVCKKIISFSPETDMFEDVMQIEDGVQHRFLAVTKDYLYFTKREPISIGFSETLFGKDEIFNYCSRIYRLSKETGEVVTVLDDIHCSTRMLFFMDDTVFLVGTVYTPHETEAFSNSAVFTAKLDENGMFTELTKIEE